MYVNISEFKYGLILSIVLIFCLSPSKAQDPDKYTEILNKTFFETSQTDFEKALQVADSLYQISETPLFQTRSLMLTASLYEQAGELKKSIKFAEQANKIIEKTEHFDWQTRVQGFMASQYRILSLYKQSEIYSDKAYEAAKKIPDQKASRITLAMIMQEKAFLAKAQNDHHKAIDLFREASKYLDDEKGNISVAQNYQLMAQTAIDLKEYDKALSYLDTALDKWDELPPTYGKGYIFINYAEAYLVKDNLDKAKYYIDQASEIAQTSTYLEFLRRYYVVKTEYFSRTDNIDNFRSALSKRDSINAILALKKTDYLDESYTDLTSKNEALSIDLETRKYLILVAIILLLSGLGYFIYYRREKNRQVEKFQAILAEFQQAKQKEEELSLKGIDEPILEPAILKEQKLKKEVTQDETQSESPIVSAEVEEQILRKLKAFEKSKHFRDPNISLPGLASYCDTNTKYLSYCINHHKGMNFNHYINNLRVQYIIDKLINEPVYRKYKFATLAEEAGFSSSNKFSTVFKKATTLAPSVFIKELEKEALEVEV
ncbi:helix-turn-helix domain-containing protein [Weeksellaceae bacterium KMM 9724]|uniref:helix-turn-helix domain-containing protein n=1 Tax=Profundicola chukchiensis TaxID=2961959 RepID=UPI0024389FE9|nr:helix-turn-helix domain-containing protein [Profundicola chukchiensis]MDG4949602.1 helix-turn-helix domain-containing protein [Profundicola chukchiensis]